ASAMALFRLRRATTTSQVSSLLELSQAAFPATYVGALVLLVAGIWAGIDRQLFTNGFNWLWASVIALVIVVLVMFTMISRHFYKVRELLKADPSANEAAVLEIVHGQQPLYGAIIGLVGLALIIYLMMAKPF
ncbi:MAG: hypothetical protein ABIZ34_03490, partial [Candidatus Limnocylindrales bacterium]